VSTMAQPLERAARPRRATFKGFGKKWRQEPPASGQKPQREIKQSDLTASIKALIEFHHAFDSVFVREEQRGWSLFYLCGQLSNLERKTMAPKKGHFRANGVGVV